MKHTTGPVASKVVGGVAPVQSIHLKSLNTSVFIAGERQLFQASTNHGWQIACVALAGLCVGLTVASLARVFQARSCSRIATLSKTTTQVVQGDVTPAVVPGKTVQTV